MIWEFRAEGTGYPDEAVGGRVWHFPWPDHHPPPFGLVPRVMGSMRDWLKPVEGVSGWPGGGKGKGGSTVVKSGNDGGNSEVKSSSKDTSSQRKSGSGGSESQSQSTDDSLPSGQQGKSEVKDGSKRVVVVHCKAGKGRSGTASCSYLISEEGWTKEAAINRFTERRMRPGWNQKGVSIPSQLRWLGYVERWKNGGKIYVERKVEVTEVHVWGLKNGVEVSVRGFIEEGKVIKVWHTFKDDEREVVRGKVGDFGFSEAVMDLVASRSDSRTTSEAGTPKNRSLENLQNKTATPSNLASGSTAAKLKAAAAKSKADTKSTSSDLSNDQKSSESSTENTDTVLKTGVAKTDGCTESKPDKALANIPGAYPATSTTAPKADPVAPTTTATAATSTNAAANNTIIVTGADAIFRPKKPIILDSNDINIDTERRTKGAYTFGLTTSVSHVWFNTFFEGNGPENNGQAATSGVFEIEWDKMDGIKGSSTRGQRAFDKLQVVWKVVDGEVGNVVREPTPGEEIRQAEPADWKGVKDKMKPDKGAVKRESSSDEEDQGTVSYVGEVAK